MRIISAIAVILGLITGQVYAGDLGMAGALSGAGQGIGNALSTYQAIEGQRQLMEQQHRQEMERMDRQFQRDREAMEVRHRQIDAEGRALKEEQALLQARRTAILAEPDPEKRRRLAEVYDQDTARFNARVDAFNQQLQALR